MKFVLAFNGSRGDVQPAVALGIELDSRGHTVTLAVPPNLAEFAGASGLSTHCYGPDTRTLLESELVSRDLKSANPVTKLRAVSEITLRGGRTMQRELMDLTPGADALVGGSAGQERALNVAQVREIPYVPLHYCPVRRNGQVSLVAPSLLPKPLIRPGWRLVEQILWRAGRSAEKALLDDLGLDDTGATVASRIARQGVPEIQAYDPALFPGLADEWGDVRPLVGFLGLDRSTRTRMGDSTSDQDLLAWIDSGPPPLYVGFGSMTVSDPERLMQIITTATDRLGLRVLLATGWSGLERPDGGDRMFATSTVDHDAILPRCIGAVHHGGAGSTAAALRAGLPTAIYWVGADQPMWARQVRNAGVGGGGALKSIGTEGLQNTLESILTPEYRRRAQGLAERIVRPEKAVARAATLIENAAAGRRRPGDAG
ncbi:glycosyltransferase [Williamsia sp.]|uniref:glycosyltransferase n=1 Tax=Williamsia sp. TaxID=1872085 RepID=UPI002F9302C0